MAKQFRIAVDFDGTIVEHDYPEIGRPVPSAFDWLRKWKDAGAMLILWTMRSDGEKQGPLLTDAVEFCRRNGVEFDAVNDGPGDREWTTSPKVYAHRYVDDASAGCHLTLSVRAKNRRPCVDWEAIGSDILAAIEDYNGRWQPHERE